MQQLSTFSAPRALPPLSARPQGERRMLDVAASRIVTFAYEMALGRAGWDEILDTLAQALPKCLVSISADDVAETRNLAFSQRGATAALGTQTPRIPLVGDVPLYEIFHDDETPLRVSTKRPAFASAAGVVIARNGSRQLILEIRYSEAKEAELRQRISALLRHIAPHLGRAIELTRREASVGVGELEEVVEALPFGLFLVDRSMRVHYANGRADALRRASSGPFVAFDGMLRATDEEADGQLRNLVLRAGHGPRSGSAALRLQSAKWTETYFVTARQAQLKTRRLHLHDAIFDSGPLVLVALHGTEPDTGLSMDLLWRSFALSDAETKLAEALVNGWTLAEFAKDREVSKQTLRNQLVGLMRKTGTRRQSELVSLLTRLALTAL